MIGIDLEGRVALVTGASRGIGRAIAEALAACGARVAVNYLQNDVAAAEVAAAIERTSGQVMLCKGSVSDRDSVDRMVSDVLARWERIDCLVNNAGIARDVPLGIMSERHWDEVMATNLKSLYLCTKRVLKPMIARRSGVILNLSSKSAEIGIAGQTNYTAAKAGVLGFTRSLAREVGPHAIRVVALVVGLIDTDLTRRLPRKMQETLLNNVPLQRIGRPDEVGMLSAFLASDLASYITGTGIDVSGGL